MKKLILITLMSCSAIFLHGAAEAEEKADHYEHSIQREKELSLLKLDIDIPELQATISADERAAILNEAKKNVSLFEEIRKKLTNGIPPSNFFLKRVRDLQNAATDEGISLEMQTKVRKAIETHKYYSRVFSAPLSE